MSDEELYHQGLMNSTKGVTGTDNPCATMEEAAEKYLPKGWDNTFTRRKFFPYWRSVLQARAFLRVYPSYATADASRPTVPTPVPGHKLPSLGKAPQLLSNRQSRRLFGTGASAARSALGYEELRRSRGSSMDSTPSQIHNLSLLVGVAQVTNDHGQSRRLFGTAASILLKVARKVLLVRAVIQCIFLLDGKMRLLLVRALYGRLVMPDWQLCYCFYDTPDRLGVFISSDQICYYLCFMKTAPNEGSWVAAPKNIVPSRYFQQSFRWLTNRCQRAPEMLFQASLRLYSKVSTKVVQQSTVGKT
uniref:Uncharacterized protein n=1 Tax=Aegilops tauschii TaxID=37682 RepID=M8CHT9_AEGTA